MAHNSLLVNGFVSFWVETFDSLSGTCVFNSFGDLKSNKTSPPIPIQIIEGI